MDGMGDEYGFTHLSEVHHQHAILCPQCGMQMPPNAANLCVNCIRTEVDITEGIPKQAIVYFCKGCDRYLSPPNSWMNAKLESRELLALCLKRLKGLSKVRLVDAGFIWTEPHSKRIKVKITIQKEVFTGAILQQVFVVEFTVTGQFCDDCHRREALDTWKAIVQVRQKARHKKTFFFLEQLIIKHAAHKNAVRIKTRPDGIDFYFASRSDGKRMVDFLLCTVPSKYKTSERLISQDIQNNTFNFKYSYCVEIVPVCKDDVICLPLKLARSCGHITQLCIVTKVGNTLHLIDPFSLQIGEIHSAVYWRHGFGSLCTHGMYTEYTVMDMEPTLDDNGNVIRQGKFMLVDCQVARVRDLGVNDIQFFTRCHLGHILQPGDNVWAYDLTNANFNDENANKLDPKLFPDVMIVKKSYSDKRKKHRRRNWRLKFLAAEEEGLARKDGKDMNKTEKELESFMQDLEEDPEYRSNVNIYHDPAVPPPASDIDEDEQQLKVEFDEMLDDFDNMLMDDATNGPDAAEQLAVEQQLLALERQQQMGQEAGMIGEAQYIQQIEEQHVEELTVEQQMMLQQQLLLQEQQMQQQQQMQ